MTKPWGIAVNLRGKRKAAGLTQRELADAVGVDFTYISKIETGQTEGYGPSRKLAARLSTVLGTPLPAPAPSMPPGWVAVPASVAADWRTVRAAIGRDLRWWSLDDVAAWERLDAALLDPADEEA